MGHVYRDKMRITIEVLKKKKYVSASKVENGFVHWHAMFMILQDAVVRVKLRVSCALWNFCRPFNKYVLLFKRNERTPNELLIIQKPLKFEPAGTCEFIIVCITSEINGTARFASRGMV